MFFIASRCFLGFLLFSMRQVILTRFADASALRGVHGDKNEPSLEVLSLARPVAICKYRFIQGPRVSVLIHSFLDQ